MTRLSMSARAKARRRRWAKSHASRQALIYKTTKAISLAEVALSGFGGHSKAHPITMVRGKKQSQWRKKLRRMGPERARKYLKAAGQ